MFSFPKESVAKQLYKIILVCPKLTTIQPRNDAMWIRVALKPWNVKKPRVDTHVCISVLPRRKPSTASWLLPCCPAAQQAVGLWLCHVSILKPCELFRVQTLWYTGFVSHLNSICRAYLALDCKLYSTLEKSKAQPCSKISTITQYR